MSDFPASSPDLNPIESVWAELNRRISARRPQTVADLRAATISAWDEIPLSHINNYVARFQGDCASLSRRRHLGAAGAVFSHIYQHIWPLCGLQTPVAAVADASGTATDGGTGTAGDLPRLRLHGIVRRRLFFGAAVFCKREHAGASPSRLSTRGVRDWRNKYKHDQRQHCRGSGYSPPPPILPCAPSSTEKGAARPSAHGQQQTGGFGFAISCDLCMTTEVPDARGMLFCPIPPTPSAATASATDPSVPSPEPLNASLFTNAYAVHVSCAL